MEWPAAASTAGRRSTEIDQPLVAPPPRLGCRPKQAVSPACRRANLPGWDRRPRSLGGYLRRRIGRLDLGQQGQLVGRRVEGDRRIVAPRRVPGAEPRLGVLVEQEAVRLVGPDLWRVG